MEWKELEQELINSKYHFHHTDNGVLLCGDCSEILSEIPDNTADLILTDPPYKISKEGNKISRNFKNYVWKRQKDIGLDFGEWDRQWEDDNEYFLWVENWFKELARIAKDKTWFYIWFDKQKIGIFDLILAPKYGLKSRTIFVWAKSNPAPSFRKVNWVSATEFCWVGSKGDSKLKNFLYQKEMFNYMIHPNKSSYGETDHPTEKPKAIFSKIVRVSTDENQIVLDPFLGSGTTAVVCEKLNRRWIGIEINPEYCEIVKKRLQQSSELHDEHFGKRRTLI